MQTASAVEFELVEYLGREQEAIVSIDGGNTCSGYAQRTALHPATTSTLTLPPEKLSYCRADEGAERWRAHALTNAASSIPVAMLCLAPSLLYVFAMFVYPFLYGVYVSLQPSKGEAWSIKNYVAFFSDPYQLATIRTTFPLALPTTVVVVLVALFVAYGMRRGIWMERTITTILVLPISLGVIFLSEGILGFYGTNGWLNQMLIGAGLIHEPLELTHNFTGVTLSLFMQNFPFCFLHAARLHLGDRSEPRKLGAHARRRPGRFFAA